MNRVPHRDETKWLWRPDEMTIWTSVGRSDFTFHDEDFECGCPRQEITDMRKGLWTSAAGVWLTLTLAVSLAAPHGALAQEQPTTIKIWEIPFGTPATELPAEFKMPACGTHWGPPSTPLRSFEEFARCPAEPDTGLHEVWFSYDDYREYYLRAIRANPELIRRYQANQIMDHLVAYSLLFDEEGRVQGHRIATDPREVAEIREFSDMLEGGLKVIAYPADGWNCTDEPPAEGEEPYGGTFVKRVCQTTDDQGRFITIRAHRFLKAGQQAPGRGGAPLAGEFESGTWAEAINADLVRQPAPQ
jgi:hypothetical protein